MIQTQSDKPTMEVLRASYTKRRELSGQRNYRFAVRLAERPLRKAIFLRTPCELLWLTKRLGM